MTQWIDQPGPDDDPVVRVEDQLAQEGAPEESVGPSKVHGDPTRDLSLQDEDARETDDDLPG